MSSDPVEFAQLLSSCRIEHPGSGRARASLELPPAWGQGRSVFGGAQAGVLLEAMATLVPEQRPRRRARSLQVTFAGPVSGPVELELELLRSGRSATIVAGRLLAEGSVRTSALACFAAPRSSAISVEAPGPPSMAGPEGLRSLPYIEGLTPAFVRAFELRWADEGWPGANRQQSSFVGWIRTREAASQLGPAWIAALVDAWPAPVLQMLKGPAPASSLSWTLEFVGEDLTARSEQWWPFAVDTDSASGGLAHTRAKLWSPGGVLVALSSQTVAVYA